MSYYVGDFPPNDYFDTPRGWVCPKCGRVYSPNTSMCLYCGSNTTTVINTTTPPNTSVTPYIGSSDIPIHYTNISPFLKNLMNNLEE